MNMHKTDESGMLLYGKTNDGRFRKKYEIVK